MAAYVPTVGFMLGLMLDPDGNLVERLPWGPAGAGQIDALGLTKDGGVAVAVAGEDPLGRVEDLLAALLAAAMSSLDSALNSLSAATMRDFIEPRFANVDEQTRGQIEALKTVYGMDYDATASHHLFEENE